MIVCSQPRVGVTNEGPHFVPTPNIAAAAAWFDEVNSPENASCVACRVTSGRLTVESAGSGDLSLPLPPPPGGLPFPPWQKVFPEGVPAAEVCLDAERLVKLLQGLLLLKDSTTNPLLVALEVRGKLDPIVLRVVAQEAVGVLMPVKG
jgi:hypothetical protein